MIIHMHHIIPRHMGGSDDPENLIALTVDEHAAAHRQLYELHGRMEDFIAWKSLSGQITNAEATHLARKHRDTSYMRTEEYRRKMSEAKSGNVPWNKGKKLPKASDETKTKMSKSHMKPLTFRGQEYPSLKEAIELSGVSKYLIKKDPTFRYL